MNDALPVPKRQLEVTEIKGNGRKTTWEFTGPNGRPVKGRWNNEAFCQILLRSDPKKWFTIEELARIAFGVASPSNQKKVRHRIAPLRNYLFKFHNRVLVKEYELRLDDVRTKGVMRKQQLKGRSVIARVKIAIYEDKAQALSQLKTLHDMKLITLKQLREMEDSLELLPAGRLGTPE
jgi:hypothetical protein